MNSEKKLYIAMLGPDLQAKGGIAAVASSLVEGFSNGNFFIDYIPTTIDRASIFKLICFFRAIMYFMIILPKVNFLHIHVASRTSFWRKTIFVLLSLIFNVPYILHIHGGSFPQFYENECNKLKQKVIKSVFNKAAVIFVLSLWWEKYLKQKITENENIILMYNSVNVEKNYVKYNGSNNKLLFIGSLSEDKGFFDLLTVMEKIVIKYPKVLLRCCGDGDLSELRKLIAKKKLDKHVELLGWVSGAQKVYQLKNSSIYILPSYFEGLPISMLEAMSFSLPVICTNVGGIPEIIQNGIDGILIRPGDIHGLYKALDRMLSNPDLCLTMGKNGFCKIINNFDCRVMLSKMSKVYEKI